MNRSDTIRSVVMGTVVVMVMVMLLAVVCGVPASLGLTIA
jgi:hypothetical protein